MSAGRLAIQVDIDGRLRRITLEQDGLEGIYKAMIDGKPVNINAQLLQPGALSLLIENRAYRCVIESGPAGSTVQIDGVRYEYRIEDPRSLNARRGRGSAAGGPQIIKAPMPGRIVRLLVEPGAIVEAHQGVVVIEAMKMQNELKAPRAGKLVELRVEEGSTVSAGEVLAVIE